MTRIESGGPRGLGPDPRIERTRAERTRAGQTEGDFGARLHRDSRSVDTAAGCRRDPAAERLVDVARGGLAEGFAGGDLRDHVVGGFLAGEFGVALDDQVLQRVQHQARQDPNVAAMVDAVIAEARVPRSHDR